MSNHLKSIIESASGCGAWLETFGRIQLKAPRLNPATNQLEFIVPPEVNFLQEQFLALVSHCLAHDLPIRVILLKPRQKGCSTVSVAFLYWLVRRMALQGMIIGGQYDQTEELWKILTRYHTHDGYPWDTGGICNTEKARYQNGGEISQRTANNENAGRAGTYQAVIVTELGRWKEGGKSSAGDVLQGVQACVGLAPNTAIILESTARGNTGVFHQQWQAAINLDDFLAGNYGPGMPFVRIFAPAHAFADSRLPLTDTQRDQLAAELTDEERSRLAEHNAPLEYIAWRRHILKTECRGNLTRMKFDYPDTPEEAFHASSQTVFSEVAIQKMRDANRGYDGSHGVMRRVSDDIEADWDFEARDLAQSDVTIWDRPRIGLRYLLVVDPMTGVSNDADGRDRDHHAGLVIRAGYQDPDRGWFPPKIVARTRPPAKDPEWNCQWGILRLEEIVFGLSRFYGGCLIVVEANKDGGLIRGLWERGAHLYRRDKTEDRAGEVMDPTLTDKFGFLTVGGKHENTRKAILEELEDAVARYGQEGEGIEIPDNRTLDEMAVFILNKAGRAEAAPGEHDDSVMALAIGHHLRKSATKYSPPVVKKPLPPELARLTQHRRTKAMYS